MHTKRRGQFENWWATLPMALSKFIPAVYAKHTNSLPFTENFKNLGLVVGQIRLKHASQPF